MFTEYALIPTSSESKNGDEKNVFVFTAEDAFGFVPKTVSNDLQPIFQPFGGMYGTRTRDLLRDRQAF